MAFWKKLLGIDDASSSDELEAEISPDFGYSKDDPIPCESIPLSYWYLSRIIRSDGSTVRYNRLGSFGSDRVPDLIDGYQLITSDGEKATIFIWPYAQTTSSNAPQGFRLLPPAPR